VVHKQKSHAQSHAWLISPVRHRTLASFGGITRIRFKGSPASHRTLSHCGSPALRLQNKTRKKDVKGGSAALSDDAKILAAFGCVNLTSSKGLLDPPPEFNVAQRRGYSGSIIISLLPPVLRSYERWPSTCPSPSSRPSRRCRCRKRPCPQTCPRPSPCKSRP
jgi:hypothetical protein